MSANLLPMHKPWNATISRYRVPTITTPNDPVIAESTGPQGAIVSFDVSASDDVGGNIVPQCIPSSGSTFRMGETTVNCTAIDGSDNLEEKSHLLKQPRLVGWAKLRTTKVQSQTT